MTPPSDDGFIEQEDDYGVFPTVIPETIRGAVALDLVATFTRERSVGECGHCGLPIVLTPHQVGRVDRGQGVFHPDCHPAHRRRWMRDYQRRRRAAFMIHTLSQAGRSENGRRNVVSVERRTTEASPSTFWRPTSTTRKA